MPTTMTGHLFHESNEQISGGLNDLAWCALLDGFVRQKFM